VVTSSGGATSSGYAVPLLTVIPPHRGLARPDEDESTPELVLVVVAVAGLEDVVDGELGQVGYSLGGIWLMIDSATWAVCAPVERQAGLGASERASSPNGE
jgi:hypothetical protein